MKIRLFLDEDVHAGLAPALRRRGYDVVHAQELELKGRTDQDNWPVQSPKNALCSPYNVAIGGKCIGKIEVEEAGGPALQ